jgi:hypothetical protein
MGMRRWLTLSILVAMGAVSRGVLLGQSAVGTTSVGEQYLFAAANAERAQRGLPELRWDAALYEAAGFHAKEMASRASISHQYPGEAELAARARQAGAHFSVIAENVAEAPTTVRIHDAWMASAGHRSNLLDPRVNAVGIRVLRRNGELYAVEDFSRAVPNITTEQQEEKVGEAVRVASQLTLLPANEDARQTCSRETGYVGSRRPGFVMRYTTADLTKLPDALMKQLGQRRYREAAVGACTVEEDSAFSSYRLAVLLYP